jgi:CheY-like chemotaxis protein
MKILVIDDEDDIRRVACLSLVKIGGLEVVEASSGPEGVRRAAEESPDAILLDVMMPTTDGPQTLSALRANPATAAIPVVFLTAKALASEVERLKAMGAAAVLTKPFDPLTLPAQIRDALRAV